MRRKYLLYGLSLASGVLLAIMVAIDIWISTKIITDPWLFGISVFWAGFFIHIFLLVVLSLRILPSKKPLGASFDPFFQGLIIPDHRTLWYLILAGFGNALSSLSYFILISMIPDPSSVMPFSYLVVVYLILGEILIEGEKPSQIEVHSIFMILLGIMLVSVSRGIIDIVGLVIVLGPMNIGAFIFNYAQRKARLIRKGHLRNDSLNLRFWSLTFTVLIFSALVYIITSPKIVFVGLLLSMIYFPILAFDMSITFFAYIFYIRALGIGKMSIVNALSSSSVVISLLLSVLLSTAFPDIYISPEITGVFGVIRIIGIVLVFLGILLLTFSEVRAYIFIKISPGILPSSIIIKKLLRIKGIELVSATAGRYDFICRVRIRSLGKAYDIIIRELMKIEGISDFIWISILKEWEKI